MSGDLHSCFVSLAPDSAEIFECQREVQFVVRELIVPRPSNFPPHPSQLGHSLNHGSPPLFLRENVDAKDVLRYDWALPTRTRFDMNRARGQPRHCRQPGATSLPTRITLSTFARDDVSLTARWLCNGAPPGYVWMVIKVR